MTEPINNNWKCHYCKKVFTSLFTRDHHHRTHKEHYEKLFHSSLEVIDELRNQINDLTQKGKKVLK